MIKDIKLNPVVLGKFMEFLTSKCTDEERAEIENLLGGSKPSEFGEAKTVVDPETFETITVEEYKKKYGDKAKDKIESFIHVSFYFDDKYREYTDELQFKASGIACKDTLTSGHYGDRPFEHCIVFEGISKDQIDKLTEKARVFLSIFSVLDVSSDYDCYNLVLFYNTKDEEGKYYIRNIWMSAQNEPLYKNFLDYD